MSAGLAHFCGGVQVYEVMKGLLVMYQLIHAARKNDSITKFPDVLIDVYIFIKMNFFDFVLVLFFGLKTMSSLYLDAFGTRLRLLIFNRAASCIQAVTQTIAHMQ